MTELEWRKFSLDPQTPLKLILVNVEMDNEEVSKPVSDYFGFTDGPCVLAYTGNEDAKKYKLDGEVTLDNVKLAGFKMEVVKTTSAGQARFLTYNVDFSTCQKNPLDMLPPSKMVLDEWKRLY